MRTPEKLSPFFRREKEFTQNEELRAISYELIGVLRSWDVLEGRHRDIIDFDLAPEDPGIQEVRRHIIGTPRKEERESILARVTELEGRLEQVTMFKKFKNVTEAFQTEFLKSKLKAHRVFCQRKLGVEFDPMEYIEATMGVKPELIPESTLLAQREVVKSFFKEFGCSEYTSDCIEQFRRERTLPGSSIAGHLSHNADFFLRSLSEFLGTKISPNFGIEVVNTDEWWLNWANGTRDKFKSKTNIHARHLGKWTEGKVEEMPVHEIVGHFGQMFGWQNAIDRGELNPALGLTSVHDPEQVTTEGIAQTLPYFVPEIKNKFSDFGKLELEVTGLRSMVYNNIHIWANNGELSENQMIEFMHQFYPWESVEEIKREINDRSNHPLKQTYRYAYGIGFYRHRRYAQTLNLEGKRKLLHLIYTQPITPEQEELFVEQLLEDHHRRYSIRDVSNGELTGVHH